MLYFIVLKSVWQTGTTSCTMVTADGRKDIINTHTTQKSLKKLLFSRVTSWHYIRHHYLPPFIISFFYVLQLCKEEIKNGSFSNLGNFGKSQIYNGHYCMRVISFSKGSECLLFFGG